MADNHINLFEVTEFRHLEIPLSDGCILSARVWMPVGAGPMPALLEYLPYRKRDGTAERDALTHPFMAARGYVCVRVDMRGCGDSEGLFEDEYTEQEIVDGVEIVNWLADQSWCSGQVGMMGISWGGFNGLQIAARAPDTLKAIVTICSTVDRFGDDIHFKGGLMLGENPGWAATALSWFSMPPDPAIVGDRWRDMWLERLENTPFLAKTWSEHQTRDEYWKHGSVCEDYSAIKAAVLSVGGWHDGYRNTISHLLTNLDAPVRGIVGPWNHKYPHFAAPGPQIDFLGEMLRWWDHWLKGIDRGVGEDPAMRAYLMDSIPPKVTYSHRPGKWVGAGNWPDHSPRVELFFNGGGLDRVPGPVDALVKTRLDCGQATGEYFPFGFGPGELPGDQAQDDALSCCFDGEPLREDLDLLGAPHIALQLSADQDCGQIAVRLCDLRPDGTSAMIAHGFLNLRQRNGHRRSEPVETDTPFDVAIDLDQCGYRLPVGHRLRVAISASYWPFAFPAGRDVNIRISSGKLCLPRLEPSASVPVHFDEPVMAEPRKTRRHSQTIESKEITHDPETDQIVHQISGNDGLIEDMATGLVVGMRVAETFRISPDDPGSAHARFHWERILGRDDWNVSTTAIVEMTGAPNYFDISMSLTAREGESEVFAKSWNAQVPRV